jgi:membrane protease YdiL (CAAX protease family)
MEEIMNSLELKHFVLLTIPFALIPSTTLVFISLARWLGKEKGYLLGFLFYWIIWCVIVPLLLLGTKDFPSLFMDKTPLFSGPNWLAAVLLAVVTLVTLFMYGKGFIQSPLNLILIAIPVAIINGICEELLWRGLYIKIFPNNLWLAVLFPAIGFALWHLAPRQIFSEGNKFTFIFSTFILGLAYGWITYRTGSAKWTAVSHSLNGILALGGLLTPNIITLFLK